MTFPLRRLVLAALILSIASPVFAQFWASDLIYVPALAHNVGEAGSRWRSDLYITNTSDDPIDVVMIFVPSGLFSNTGSFTERTQWLGGREVYETGHINESLAGIPPRGTVVLEDVVGEYWPDHQGTNGLGAMVVFAMLEETLDPEGDYDPRDAVVMSRTYNDTTVLVPDEDSHRGFVEVPGTYGQTIPGVPWYNLADPSAVSEEGDLTFYVLTGGIENDDFRYNVGVLNLSDIQTQVTLSLQPFQLNGDPYLNGDGEEIISTVTMPPVSHLQYNQVMSSLFGIVDPGPVMLKVSFIGWQSSGPEPVPAFTTYGSVIDWTSNDPTTVLPSFGEPYDVDCIWGDDPETKSLPGRNSRRPHRIPGLAVGN